MGVLSYVYLSLFLSVSVSAVELQAHTELDPDADGMFTEEEAQVRTSSHTMCLGWVDSIPAHRGVHRAYRRSFKTLLRKDFLVFQGVLGGVATVDTGAFETIWSSIKEKYVSEVTVWVFGRHFRPFEHGSMQFVFCLH